LKLKCEHPEPRWFTEGVSELVAWQVESQLSQGSRRWHLHLRIEALKRCQKERLDIVDSRTWYAEQGGNSPDSSAGYACSLYAFVQLAERHGPDLIRRIFDALHAGAAPSLSTQDLLPVVCRVTGESVEPLFRRVSVKAAIKFFEERLAEQSSP
jgi:hypothetical protein